MKRLRVGAVAALVFGSLLLLLGYIRSDILGNVDDAAREVDAEIIAERDRQEAAHAASSEVLLRQLVTRNDAAATPRGDLAKSFRETFPFHTQVLALSAPAEDGSRTLLISEPPPDVSLTQVLSPLAGVLRGHELQRTKIGNDGWLTDVVVSVAGSDAEISNALSAVSRRVFGTSYKSYVLPLPAVRSKADYNLDLNVTAAELREWVQSDAQFVPVEGGAVVTVPDILRLARSEVFSSRTPGLVAWWLPKNVAVRDCRVQVRQFALDSDLVIGALSKPNGILIFGRERRVPVDLLPPLRYETVELLAAVQRGQAGQLAQSYERDHAFAGRMRSGKDWAPILLSPELIDTEYGSLLNITDQLLKGWSNAGRTRYINFKYSRPSRYPFGDQTVDDKLAANELVYNWNTKGAGYVVATDEAQYFALNRAGALPVTYVPAGRDSSDAGEDVMAAEDVAYEYFARMSDPNLVRVVQYAALYQIFSAFDVTNRNVAARESSFQSEKLEELTNELNAELKNASDEELTRIADQLAPHFPKLFVEWSDTPKTIVRRHLTAYRDGDFSLDAFDRRLVLSMYADLRELPKRYATTVSAQSSAWIHTPAVVVSWNEDEVDRIAIGGHNLDAKITDLALSADVSTVRVAENGAIRLNPELGAKARSLVRTAARFSDEPASVLEARLQQLINKLPKTPPRALAEALDLHHAPVLEPAGLTPVAGAAERGSLRLVGWGRPRSTIVPDDVARLNSDSAAAVVVDRRAEAIYLRHATDGAPIRAFTIEDATDAVATLLRREVAGGRELHIELRGFTNEEGVGFARSCQIRAKDENIPAEVSALVRDKSIGDGAFRALRSERFDAKKTTIKVGMLEELPTEVRQHMTVEMPKIDGQGTGRADIALAFEKQTPRSVISKIVDRISAAVKQIVAEMGGRFDAVVFNYRLNAAIKRISLETGVDIRLVRQQFRDGQHDVIFAGLYDLYERLATPVDRSREPA